jgi:hypothetical protein
VRKDGARAVLL